MRQDGGRSGHSQVNSPRGTMPRCLRIDQREPFGLAFRLTSSATPCGVYHRDGLSFLGVEDRMAERGITMMRELRTGRTRLT